jgi:hypothetical protein
LRSSFLFLVAKLVYETGVYHLDRKWRMTGLHLLFQIISSSQIESSRPSMQEIEFLFPPTEILESLLALAICALILLRMTLAFLYEKEKPRATGKYWLEGFFWAVGVFLLCFLAADVGRTLIDKIDRSLLVGLSILSAILVVGFAAVGFAAGFGASVMNRPIQKTVQATHFAILLSAGIWFAYRTHMPTVELITEGPGNSANLMSESSSYLAITDSGTQIALFEIDLRDRSQATRDFLATSTATPSGAKVIPRADANINANCHGWVFTGGKYLLRGRGVDQILLDNGYSVQGMPEAGDLIVYRNEQGEVLHTGIVSGILLDGTCIIESKWGIAGRFLHQAEDQPYGLNYAFYRSERSGHLVTVIHRDEVDAFLVEHSRSQNMTSSIVDDELYETQLAPTLDSELEEPFAD